MTSKESTNSHMKYPRPLLSLTTIFPLPLLSRLSLAGLSLTSTPDVEVSSSRQLQESSSSDTCDCVMPINNTARGCIITRAAPPGKACKCRVGTYEDRDKKIQICEGQVVKCGDASAASCKEPGTGVDSCLQGRGDCDGYIKDPPPDAFCECEYYRRRDGCQISEPAPMGHACKCIKNSNQTCTGVIVRCDNIYSDVCREPSTDIGSCYAAEGGNCYGYSATCDCKYKYKVGYGGCYISEEAPVGTACHCGYSLFWTCYGSIVKCARPGDALCNNPDKSKASCELAVWKSDCIGY